MAKPALGTMRKFAQSSLVKWTKQIALHSALKKTRILKGFDLHRLSQAVEIEVVNPKVMIQINNDYRGKPKVTDVLSFQAPDIFIQQGILGELVICGPVCLKQAEEQGHNWKVEMDILIVHGLLHLLGFDHEKSSRDAKKMKRLEDELFNKQKRKQLKGLISRTSVAKRGK